MKFESYERREPGAGGRSHGSSLIQQMIFGFVPQYSLRFVVNFSLNITITENIKADCLKKVRWYDNSQVTVATNLTDGLVFAKATCNLTKDVCASALHYRRAQEGNGWR